MGLFNDNHPREPGMIVGREIPEFMDGTKAQFGLPVKWQ